MIASADVLRPNRRNDETIDPSWGRRDPRVALRAWRAPCISGLPGGSFTHGAHWLVLEVAGHTSCCSARDRSGWLQCRCVRAESRAQWGSRGTGRCGCCFVAGGLRRRSKRAQVDAGGGGASDGAAAGAEAGGSKQDAASTIGSGQGTTMDAGATLPMGNIPGTWTLAFDDEFDGTSLDSNKWTTMSGGGWGSTTCDTANVSVSGGNLVLTLASASSGGCACTGSACAPAFGGSFSAGSGSYDLPVGGYTEARVNLPGSGTNIYNWPAWWTSGPDWPAGGEHDICEGLGTLTENYHSPSGSHNNGTIPGTWSNAFHVYGLHRMTSSADVYYDGQKVMSYATDDNGSPESLLFDVVNGYGTAMYGASSQVLVDYVRAWQ